MKDQKELLRVLAECADECERCYDACLENERTNELIRTLRLCRDCAKSCRVTSSFVASNSEYAGRMVDLCEEICNQCAELCSHHKDEEQECSACAKVCRKCAEACKSFESVAA